MSVFKAQMHRIPGARPFVSFPFVPLCLRRSSTQTEEGSVKKNSFLVNTRYSTSRAALLRIVWLGGV